MTKSRAHLTIVPALVWCLLMPAAAAAQQTVPDVSESGRKSGTYFKPGIAYWQGDIFSESSLTHWDVDLFNTEYNLTSVGLEFETYFRHPWPISGFAIGYRKDSLNSTDTGHLFSGTLFHDFDLKAIAIKAGGGMEWGIPALTFDQTEFNTAPDGTVRYRHTYPGRNSTVPVGASPNGVLYPFFVVSAVQRPGGLLFEFGMRVNFITFHFDDYEVRPGDQLTRGFEERRVVMPYLFANFGLRMF